MGTTLINLPVHIETNRLLFRQWNLDDADQLFALQQDNEAELHQWFGGVISKKNLNLIDIQNRILDNLSAFYSRSGFEFAVFDKETKTLIGGALLHTFDWSVPSGRIGYYVDKGHSSKGYATEIAHVLTDYAFKYLGLERLEIRASTNNPASHKIPRKLGYELEGTLKKVKKATDGALWDLEIHTRFDNKGLPELNINYS